MNQCRYSAVSGLLSAVKVPLRETLTALQIANVDPVLRQNRQISAVSDVLPPTFSP